MADAIANAVLLLAGAYAAVGCVVAVAFAARGIQRVDPGAAHAPIGFRLIILPGAAALWPWALAKWARAQSTPKAVPAT